MATILVFKVEGRAPDVGAGPRTGRPAQRTAEIVIFPGVRYEPAVHPNAARRAARPAAAIVRDRLELIE